MVSLIKPLSALYSFRNSFLKGPQIRGAYNVSTYQLLPCTLYRCLHGNTFDSDEIVKNICQGDEALTKKLQILMLEVEVMRQDGRCAPDLMQMKHWKQLLDLPTKNQRSNYLKYLWKTEKSKENQKAKKEAKKKEYQTTSIEETKEYPDDQLYGISHHTLYLRIRDKSINNFDNYRALQSMMYGQKIVIDCSYENNMVSRESVNAAKQVTFVFAANRMHKEPFDLHLCNVKTDGDFMKQLQVNVPTLQEPYFPINIHTKSYLDCFPKESLVYLTPYCREELTEFDHNTIYIIGCMVDKTNSEKLSLAKAKRDGLKMAKLPLDRYLEWGPGGKKNLNINHMVPILQDLKISGDWEYALRHVPRRKLMDTAIHKIQSKHKPNIFQKDTNIRSKVIQRLFESNPRKFKKGLRDDEGYY